MTTSGTARDAAGRWPARLMPALKTTERREPTMSRNPEVLYRSRGVAMTPAQLDEARRWVALRGWRYGAMEGAQWVRPDGPPIRVVEIHDAGNALQEHGWLPDLTDAATRGCLLALARIITGRPELSVRHHPEVGQWRPVLAVREWSGPLDVGHPTEDGCLLRICERHEQHAGGARGRGLLVILRAITLLACVGMCVATIAYLPGWSGLSLLTASTVGLLTGMFGIFILEAE